MNKTLYSVEFRKSVVGEILEARSGNPNFNMVAFVREKHPELVIKRLSPYNWCKFKKLGHAPVNLVKY